MKWKIGKLDLLIKIHFVNNKHTDVRRGIMPGNTKSLWTAVHIAKDINSQTLSNPNKMSFEKMKYQT